MYRSGSVHCIYNRNKTAGWLEYKLTDNTKLKSFSILQDVHTISEANVKVRTGTDKWKDLGTFDRDKNF